MIAGPYWKMTSFDNVVTWAKCVVEDVPVRFVDSRI